MRALLACLLLAACTTTPARESELPRHVVWVTNTSDHVGLIVHGPERDRRHSCTQPLPQFIEGPFAARIDALDTDERVRFTQNANDALARIYQSVERTARAASAPTPPSDSEFVALATVSVTLRRWYQLLSGSPVRGVVPVGGDALWTNENAKLRAALAVVVLRSFCEADADGQDALTALLPSLAEAPRDAEFWAHALSVANHAENDLELRRAVLDASVDAARQDPVIARARAPLEDRFRLSQGQPQVFGTQIRCQDGRAYAPDVQEQSSVDRRRSEIGLPPLEGYLAMFAPMCAQSSG